MKILFDTDIGDEIDDAIALYAAMRQGIEIVGVTTVFGNTVERARQAKKLLKDYANGYEAVPVYAGYGTPIASAMRAVGHIPHYTPELEADCYAPDGREARDAVDFIIDACHRYGRELTVVAVGPFTNLARVIERDADALNSIASVVIMGGAFYKQYADWNVMCDVEAAERMFCSLDNLECIGADVTHLTVADPALCECLLRDSGRGSGFCYLSALYGLWKDANEGIPLVLHDPLVIYYLSDPALCEMEEAPVVVLTEGYARGMTLNVDAYGKSMLNVAYANFDRARKVRVAHSVDLAAFHPRILKDFTT